MLTKINENYELYSFDIFDTLITRKTATPQGIFAIMQEILLRDNKYSIIPLYIRENIYDYRMKSEYYQYSYNNCVNNYQDCSFEEIYTNFKDNFGLTENQIQNLMTLELQIEMENLIPIEENISYIKELLAEKQRVILISDMYHSEIIIRKFLTNIDSIFENIKIYVSSEYKKKKRDGELYKLVNSFENIEYSKWKHFGDNAISDYKSALDIGLNANRFEYPELKPYEQYAINRTPTNTALQQTIGIAKITRLSSNNEKFHLGSSLAAPILFPYVSWLLSESIKKNYKRLYFIARDGYILKAIADKIISKQGLDISTHYIYGSRVAWQKPSFAVSLENLKPIVLQYGFSIEFLSKILDISTEKLNLYAKQCGIKTNNTLDLEQKLELFNKLLTNQEFMNEINEKSKDTCNDLINYLKQEIDFSDDNFAFVDLTGSGVTQNCLASVINTFYPKAINSFYIRNGQYKVEPQNVNRFYYMLRNDACALLECLSRAPHGQTLGYKKETDKYFPILEDTAMDTWDFDEYLNGILTYTEFWLDLCKSQNVSVLVPVYYLDWLIKHIDKNTAEQIGSMSFSHVGKEEKSAFAPKIRRRDALKYLFGVGTIKTDNYRLSYSRSKSSTKRILDFKAKHPDLRKEIFHIRFHRRKKEFSITILGIKISLRTILWGKNRETK